MAVIALGLFRVSRRTCVKVDSMKLNLSRRLNNAGTLSQHALLHGSNAEWKPLMCSGVWPSGVPVTEDQRCTSGSEGDTAPLQAFPEMTWLILQEALEVLRLKCPVGLDSDDRYVAQGVTALIWIVSVLDQEFLWISSRVWFGALGVVFELNVGFLRSHAGVAEERNRDGLFLLVILGDACSRCTSPPESKPHGWMSCSGVDAAVKKAKCFTDRSFTRLYSIQRECIPTANIWQGPAVPPARAFPKNFELIRSSPLCKRKTFMCVNEQQMEPESQTEGEMERGSERLEQRPISCSICSHSGHTTPCLHRGGTPAVTGNQSLPDPEFHSLSCRRGCRGSAKVQQQRRRRWRSECLHQHREQQGEVLGSADRQLVGGVEVNDFRDGVERGAVFSQDELPVTRLRELHVHEPVTAPAETQRMRDEPDGSSGGSAGSTLSPRMPWGFRRLVIPLDGGLVLETPVVLGSSSRGSVHWSQLKDPRAARKLRSCAENDSVRVTGCDFKECEAEQKPHWPKRNMLRCPSVLTGESFGDVVFLPLPWLVVLIWRPLIILRQTILSLFLLRSRSRAKALLTNMAIPFFLLRDLSGPISLLVRAIVEQRGAPTLICAKTSTYWGLGLLKGHDVERRLAPPEFLRFHFYQPVLGRHDLHLHTIGKHRAEGGECFSSRAGAVCFVGVLKVQVLLSPVGPEDLALCVIRFGRLRWSFPAAKTQASVQCEQLEPDGFSESDERV
ncbi:hypothetical protein DNTS_025986 [Danionella cerebrum]|uniref:Uncharacterized protein n=1 Tax=Danionella cerebrum TaxID=2873325 RepID=A0A553PVE9_9TELE|nr:hypothetical protein DNTS_025986 [Danionella translucida]